MIWLFMGMIMGTANAGIISADEPVLKTIEATYRATGLEAGVSQFSNYMVTNYINKVSIVKTGSGLFMMYRNQCVNFTVDKFHIELKPDSSKIEWTLKL